MGARTFEIDVHENGIIELWFGNKLLRTLITPDELRELANVVDDAITEVEAQERWDREAALS